VSRSPDRRGWPARPDSLPSGPPCRRIRNCRSWSAGSCRRRCWCRRCEDCRWSRAAWSQSSSDQASRYRWRSGSRRRSTAPRPGSSAACALCSRCRSPRSAHSRSTCLRSTCRSWSSPWRRTHRDTSTLSPLDGGVYRIHGTRLRACPVKSDRRPASPDRGTCHTRSGAARCSRIGVAGR